MEGEELAKIGSSDNPLVRAVIADKNGVIVSKRCVLCLSPHRSKAEDMYEQKQTLPAIRKFLEDGGQSISPPQLRYHFEAHYKSQMYQIALADYSENLEARLKYRRDSIAEQEAIKEICWIEVARHLGMTELSEDDRNKFLKDKFDTIIAATNVIKTFEDGEAKAKAIEDRFEKIWILAIEGATTEEEKNLLKLTLQKFKSTAPLTKGSP